MGSSSIVLEHLRSILANFSKRKDSLMIKRSRGKAIGELTVRYESGRTRLENRPALETQEPVRKNLLDTIGRMRKV